MITQEQIKVMKKHIPNSSNLLLFRKSYIHSKIPTDYPRNPWGFITVPIPIPYPCPWESPLESPYPRQPCLTHPLSQIPGYASSAAAPAAAARSILGTGRTTKCGVKGRAD